MKWPRLPICARAICGPVWIFAPSILARCRALLPRGADETLAIDVIAEQGAVGFTADR